MLSSWLFIVSDKSGAILLGIKTSALDTFKIGVIISRISKYAHKA